MDSIRFICAIWVACSHGGYPPLTITFDKDNTIEWLINGIYTSLFCGPAAVIIFFLISGFCIHYPYRESWHKKNILPFIMARVTRISAPIICAAVIVKLIGFNTSLFYLLIGWSIVCELSYYVFYPFLRSLINKKTGWLKFLIFSYTPTVLVFWFYPLNEWILLRSQPFIPAPCKSISIVWHTIRKKIKFCSKVFSKEIYTKI